jgi:DNA-binding response OmpR family regulator
MQQLERPRRILLADDEQGMRGILMYALSREGFDVMTAESGAVAVVAAKTQRWDRLSDRSATGRR